MMPSVDYGDPHGNGSLAGGAYPLRCRARRRHPVLQGSDRIVDLEVNMTDLISEADYLNALAAGYPNIRSSE